MNVVALQDASVRIGERVVWSDVDVTVGEGEFVAVLGPNGVGKSTLIKVLLGLVPLASGRVEVLGGSPVDARPGIGCDSGTPKRIAKNTKTVVKK